MTQLALYESAKEALAEALRVDEVLSVRDTAERIRLYGRQAKDKRIIADATALMLRAERKLGVLLISAKETGELGIGRPGKSNLGRQAAENGAGEEPFSSEVVRATLKDAGIDKKLSARAQRWAKVGDPEFEEHLSKVRDKIESDGAVVVNPLKDLSTSQKKARRAEREAALGKKQAALPEAKFGVIYADPEWLFETHSENGMDRAADNHYPTSKLEAIKARDVGSLAADDSVLFLWATVPGLAQALEVMAAWGFAYKSNFNWHKDKVGTGFWNRNRHEHLLIGTRGHVPAPAMGEQFESSIEAAVGAHSAKPEIFHEIIERYFPTLPRIELNARTARAGWARWGFEAPELTSGEIVGAVVDGLRGGLAGSGVENQVAEAVGGALVEIFDGRASAMLAYQDALAGIERGKLTIKTAEELLRLGRAANRSPLLLADDLGHPLGTIKTWLNRLGLTSLEHMHEMNAARAAAARGGE